MSENGGMFKSLLVLGARCRNPMQVAVCMGAQWGPHTGHS